MTSPVIYFAANEDEAMVQVGGGTVVTTAGTFRSGVARCSLSLPAAGTTNNYWQNETPYAATSFWQSARAGASSTTGTSTGNPLKLLWWTDANGVERLRIRSTQSSNPQVYTVQKVDSSNAATVLGGTFSWTAAGSGKPDKIDVFINYAVAGQVAVYINNALVFSFTGDVTTNGITSLAYSRLGVQDMNGKQSYWSEVIVSDSDTRSWGLGTAQPVANGNTHNFDGGSPGGVAAASNVNEITLDDTTFDSSTTALQLDQYTIPSAPVGYGFVAWGVSARMARGATGPAHMDLNVRTGGSDFFSADQALTTSLANYQNWWTTNPNTGAPWLVAPDNIGLRSVT